MALRVISFLILGLMAVNASAVNLIDIYHEARQHDPVYLQAVADYKASVEVYPQARALLLPQMELIANTTGNYVERSQLPRPRGGTHKYNSHAVALNLSQSVFDFALWVQLSEANAQLRAAKATLLASEQQLMARVVERYLRVLETDDDLFYTEAEKKAVGTELRQINERYKVGLDTITDVYNSKAAFDSVAAQVIAAENLHHNAKEDLRELTGRYYPRIAYLNKSFPLTLPTPRHVEPWAEMAYQHNWSVVSAYYSAQAACKRIGIAQAGHLPTLTAKGQAARTFIADTGTGITNQKDGFVSLELDLPIFEGGTVVSQTRQAVAENESAQGRLEEARRAAVNLARQSHNDVVYGIKKIRADEKAIKSNKNSLEGTEAAFKIGTRTIIDVLDAETSLYNSAKIHARDMYTYINAMIGLKLAAGTLAMSDLEVINHWLREGTPVREVYTGSASFDDISAGTKKPGAQSKKAGKHRVAKKGTGTKSVKHSAKTHGKAKSAVAKKAQAAKTVAQKPKPKVATVAQKQPAASGVGPRPNSYYFTGQPKHPAPLQTKAAQASKTNPQVGVNALKKADKA